MSAAEVPVEKLGVAAAAVGTTAAVEAGEQRLPLVNEHDVAVVAEAAWGLSQPGAQLPVFETGV